MPAGKRMISSSYTTFADNARYTMYLALRDYVPAGGTLAITLPPEVKLTGTRPSGGGPDAQPVLSYEIDGAKLEEKAWSEGSLTLTATEKVPVGDYQIEFGGLKNPRSFQPTGIFKVDTADKDGYAIASGSVDNIRMNDAGKFTIQVLPGSP